MISVEHLSKSFEGLDVLKDVNCEIDKGEVICVIGPSGAGKSTFLRCLNMLEKPTSGRIIFEGADLTDKHTDLNLHRQIFDGVYDHAGQLRATDIVKSEWVLEKDTVFYLHWEELRMALDSNFQFERNLHYDELNKEDLLEWIAFFTAGIWHIHPFNEGNTRTIAVFSILLLRPLGYDIHTDVFADHSWYFRNAMVRANYMNELKHIHVNPDFLIRFYRNWMFGDQWDLRNRYLAIHPTLAWLNQPNLAEKQEE